MECWRAAREDQLKAERDLASARGEQYAQVIKIGPRWDVGAPLPHLISNGSRAFVVCLASQPDPEWDGTYVKVASPAGADPSLFVVIEMRGCSQIRFGGPSDEAMSGHPLYGKGLDGYQAHEVFNSRWIEEAITVVPGVERVSSRSIRGASEISVTFAPSTDMTYALQQTQARVNQTGSSLPQETWGTYISRAGIGSLYWAARHPAQAWRVLLPVQRGDEFDAYVAISAHCTVVPSAPAARAACP